MLYIELEDDNEEKTYVGQFGDTQMDIAIDAYECECRVIEHYRLTCNITLWESIGVYSKYAHVTRTYHNGERKV